MDMEVTVKLAVIKVFDLLPVSIVVGNFSACHASEYDIANFEAR